jgi:predicted membrane-bound spermidine synthase
MEFVHAGAQVDVVEINPAVVPVAIRFFDLELDRIHLTIDDGRHFLNRCNKKYDAVILDAFLGDSSPSHLLTHEAFASIRHVLRPGGVLTINAFGHLDEGEDFFIASLNKTLKSVFTSVKIHTRGEGQMFFAASDRAPLVFVHPPNTEGVHPSVLQDLQLSYIKVVDTNPQDGRVLTDDYNPAEFYDARNREKLRRSLAMSAKTM